MYKHKYYECMCKCLTVSIMVRNGCLQTEIMHHNLTMKMTIKTWETTCPKKSLCSVTVEKHELFLSVQYKSPTCAIYLAIKEYAGYSAVFSMYFQNLWMWGCRIGSARFVFPPIRVKNLCTAPSYWLSMERLGGISDGSGGRIDSADWFPRGLWRSTGLKQGNAWL